MLYTEDEAEEGHQMHNLQLLSQFLLLRYGFAEETHQVEALSDINRARLAMDLLLMDRFFNISRALRYNALIRGRSSRALRNLSTTINNES
ncbi:hypothetical protein AMTR_s00182p00027100 [Amborella trichopoda]|uniref:Uncharacterized protein n=1 Tax=Amborella trichopoda TaxID=13333 RepID=U5D256_AMBTC|nr:hypothetical protein AMTR_s00182p00027100 [Amborella trichopoda]